MVNQNSCIEYLNVTWHVLFEPLINTYTFQKWHISALLSEAKCWNEQSGPWASCYYNIILNFFISYSFSFPSLSSFDTNIITNKKSFAWNCFETRENWILMKTCNDKKGHTYSSFNSKDLHFLKFWKTFNYVVWVSFLQFKGIRFSISIAIR